MPLVDWNISNCDCGVVVPMAILPEFCWIKKWLSPTTSPPVDIVEVAVVEVALKPAMVGVVVLTMLPVASVERMEFAPVPESVMVGVEKDCAVRVVALIVAPPILPPDMVMLFMFPPVIVVL